jgi:hypothetical protein
MARGTTRARDGARGAFRVMYEEFPEEMDE